MFLKRNSSLSAFPDRSIFFLWSRTIIYLSKKKFFLQFTVIHNATEASHHLQMPWKFVLITLYLYLTDQMCHPLAFIVMIATQISYVKAIGKVLYNADQIFSLSENYDQRNKVLPCIALSIKKEKCAKVSFTHRCTSN